MNKIEKSLSISVLCFFLLLSAKAFTDLPKSHDYYEDLAGGITVPTLTVLHENFEIDGANMWLFAVDDGENDLAVSAEKNGTIVMGRWNPGSPTEPVTWETVATASDTGGTKIADHWHIFAHGYHWISFSVSSANKSYLLKLDTNFKRIGLYPIVNAEKGVVTNDMFLVEEAEGVAVGHFLPSADVGSRVYRFNTNGELLETVDIGGGNYAHSNGSSALWVDGELTLLASETLNFSETGGILKIQVDESWEPTSVDTLLFENNKNIAMATAVVLNTGYWIINARVHEEGTTQTSSNTQNSDGGSLVQYILSPEGLVLSEEVFVESKANRPHTLFFGDWLITTWDADSKILGRIQRVNL
jgi:hypothetical protein